jgi:hypothetical protein
MRQGAGLIIDAYDWPGGREAVLRFGPDTGPVVALALPPLEEANRTRTFAVRLLRALAARGIGSILPDLPGTGESLVPLERTSLADWRAAFSAAAVGADYGAAIRAGALIDADASLKGRWRLAPLDGASLVRELVRVRQAAARESGETFDPQSIVVDGPPIAIAGNAIPRALLRELSAAAPATAGSIRTVRLESDARDADAKLPGSALWRRAEPGDDPELAEVLAVDIADWIATCAA